jgi:hypothetical protein
MSHSNYSPVNGKLQTDALMLGPKLALEHNRDIYNVQEAAYLNLFRAKFQNIQKAN